MSVVFIVHRVFVNIDKQKRTGYGRAGGKVMKYIVKANELAREFENSRVWHNLGD